MRAGKRAGAPRCSGSGRSQGGGDHKKNLPGKEELDACTIVNKDYSKEEYACLTPIEKLKLWMIRNPGKTPGTGPTRQSRASIASASSTGTKRTADASHEGDTANNDNHWGHADCSGNRNNLGIAGLQHAKSQKIDTDK